MTRNARSWVVLGAALVVVIAWLLANPFAASDREDVPPEPGKGKSTADPVLIVAPGGSALAPETPATDPRTPIEDTPVPRHVIRGRVTDIHDGRPLSGARVRACLGEDGWALRDAAEGVVETSSAEDGRYELAIGVATLPTHVVLTAELVGYASPHTQHVPEDQVEVSAANPRARIEVAGTSTIDLPLYPGITFAGTVVDPRGAPIPGVDVLAGQRGDSWMSYIENTRTDTSGRFWLYDLKPAKFREADAKGWIQFTHPVHTQVELADVYAKAPSERRALRIVMPRGLDVSGTLTHADGAPAANLLMVAFRGEPNDNRRGSMTAERGEFTLKGLAPGPVVLRAMDATRLTYLRREIRVLRHVEDLDLRLELLPDARNVKRESLLGIEFIAMPDAMHAALEMHASYRLLITAIGDDAPEAFRTDVRPGDVLWSVSGYKGRIESRRDLVEAIVKRVDWMDHWRSKGGHELLDPSTVGVTLGFRSAHMEGTHGRSIPISRKQLAKLRAWLDEHAGDD